MKLHRDAKIERLASIDVLSGLTARELSKISALTTEIQRKADAVLVREGEIGREVLLLVSGTAAVSKHGEAVAVVREGGIMGEMAILADRPRGATVTALTDVTVLAMSLGEFHNVIRLYPQVSAAIREVVETRTEQNDLLRVG